VGTLRSDRESGAAGQRMLRPSTSVAPGAKIMVRGGRCEAPMAPACRALGSVIWRPGARTLEYGFSPHEDEKSRETLRADERDFRRSGEVTAAFVQVRGLAGQNS